MRAGAEIDEKQEKAEDRRVETLKKIAGLLLILFVFLFLTTGCASPSVDENIRPDDAPDRPDDASNRQDMGWSPRGRRALSGFDTPEEAMIAYLEGLRDSDLDRMMSAFAIETYILNYDLEYIVDRLGSYMITLTPRMPNTNEFITAINVEHRRGEIASLIGMQQLFLSNHEHDFLRPYLVDDAGEFVRQLDRGLGGLNLQSIDILGFIPPEELHHLHHDPLNLENMQRQANTIGADQLKSMVVAFELNRSTYLLTADVANYDGRWYIASFGGNIGALLGISVGTQGIVPPMDFGWHFDWDDILGLIQ